jgi:hypothetical protein
MEFAGLCLNASRESRKVADFRGLSTQIASSFLINPWLVQPLLGLRTHVIAVFFETKGIYRTLCCEHARRYSACRPGLTRSDKTGIQYP